MMTIIVIIILATAVIQSFSNNNPIEKAKEAKEAHEKANLKESANINYLNWYSDSVTGNTTKTAEKYVKEELERQGFSSTEIEKVEITENGVTIKETITFNKKSDLALGKEVTASNEAFYIIGGDTVGNPIDDNTQNIILLSKYNLKKEDEEITLKQDTSGGYNNCVFSSTAYWSAVEGITYPADLNDEEKYPIGSATSVITTAKEYGASLGVTGRLMTKEEAEALKTGYSSILYGDDSTGYLNYWLGSAYSADFVWGVYGYGNHFGDYYFGSYFGVRPVITVSKSLIK